MGLWIGLDFGGSFGGLKGIVGLGPNGLTTGDEFPENTNLEWFWLCSDPQHNPPATKNKYNKYSNNKSSNFKFALLTWARWMLRKRWSIHQSFWRRQWRLVCMRTQFRCRCCGWISSGNRRIWCSWWNLSRRKGWGHVHAVPSLFQIIFQSINIPRCRAVCLRV